jgi:hypothetical protein
MSYFRVQPDTLAETCSWLFLQIKVAFGLNLQLDRGIIQFYLRLFQEMLVCIIYIYIYTHTYTYTYTNTYIQGYSK